MLPRDSERVERRQVSGLAYALDFPHSKGFIREELLVTPSRATQEAFDTLEPVVVSTAARDMLNPEGYELSIAEGIKSWALIPIVTRGRALGVLGIGRTTAGSFPAQDLDFLCQASGQIAIAIENASAYREISQLKDRLAQEKLYLEEEIRSERGFEQLVGSSPTLKHVLQLVDTVAPSDSTVLILGETGTGKKLIARAIHEHSRRKDRTFIKLNCAAIPTGLLTSCSKSEAPSAIEMPAWRFSQLPKPENSGHQL